MAAGPLGLVQLFAAGQPWLEGALASLGRRHSLLTDLSAALPAFQQALSELPKLPESSNGFSIWVESLTLRHFKTEAEEAAVPLQVPNAPWGGFRRRFNLLPRAARIRVLQSLPLSNLAPRAFTESLAPDAEWVVLWESVSSGVPANCMPVEWHRFLPAEDHDGLACPNIVLSRDSKQAAQEPLGRWLFRAAAVQEQQRTDAGNFELILPSWVLPKRPDLLLNELDGIIQRLGGMPGDEQLQKVLGALRHLYNPFEGSEIVAPTPREILSLAREWHGKDAHVEGLAGVSSLRSGNPEEARMAYMRLFNKATERKDVALALANLAGLDLITVEGMGNAKPMLLEALKLNPWSGVAKRAIHVLQSRASLAQGNREESN